MDFFKLRKHARIVRARVASLKTVPSRHGDGRVERTSRVKLKIPAGIDEGARLRSRRRRSWSTQWNGRRPLRGHSHQGASNLSAGRDRFAL